MRGAAAIPDDFARAVVRRYGETGRAWLDALPATLATCAGRWRVEIGPPFAPLTRNYVAAARREGGERVVLKAHAPDGGGANEAAALALFGGRGGVRLREYDPERAVLLIERCDPGTRLRDVSATDDERAVEIACATIRRLRQPPPAGHRFPAMGDWNAALHRLRPYYGGGTGPFPAALIAEVERLLPELTASAPAPTLLHGDLHHDNILAAGDGWRAIDPKGLIGDPAYEVAAMLYNPLPDLLRAPDPARVLARRVAGFAVGLDLDRGRVRGWGIVRATLSAWWSAEAGGAVWAEALTCAELLRGIGPEMIGAQESSAPDGA